jgi:hypothetical protein
VGIQFSNGLVYISTILVQAGEDQYKNIATYIAGNIDNLKVLRLVSIGITIELVLNLNQPIIEGNTVLGCAFEDRRIRELN